MRDKETNLTDSELRHTVKKYQSERGYLTWLDEDPVSFRDYVKSYAGDPVKVFAPWKIDLRDRRWKRNTTQLVEYAKAFSSTKELYTKDVSASGSLGGSGRTREVFPEPGKVYK